MDRALMVDKEALFVEYIQPLIVKAVEMCDANDISYVFVAKMRNARPEDGEPSTYAIAWNPCPMTDEDNILKDIVDKCQEHGLDLNP